MSHKTS